MDPEDSQAAVKALLCEALYYVMFAVYETESSYSRINKAIKIQYCSASPWLMESIPWS